MTRRTTAARRRRDTPGRLVVAGIVTLVVIVGVALLTLRAPNGAPGLPRDAATVYLPDVGSLRAHNDVRVAGVLIGQVKEVKPYGSGAEVRLQLFPSAGRVPADSTAAVRSAGLLGQRYLQILPGKSSETLADGGVLRAAGSSITLGIPDALETFDAATRRGLGQTVRGLGGGVLGEGQHINEGLDAAPQAARDFRASVDAVTADRAAVRGLLPALNRAAGALDGARTPIAQMLAPADRALAPFADQRAAVRATLAAAPGAFAAATPGLTAGERLLTTVRRLSTSAARTLPQAPAALRATTRLLRSSHAPLRKATPLVRQLRATVPSVLHLTHDLDPVLAPLEQPLDRLREPLDVLGTHGCDVVNFARVWRSFLGFGSVPGGKIGRLGEIRAEAIVNFPFAGAGDNLELPDALSERDLYPAPCKYAGSVHPTLP